MKLRYLALVAATGLLVMPAVAREVELFSYSKPDGQSGLRFAWRADSASQWQSVGKEFDLVKSDFGPWGSHKKMYSPVLFRDTNGGDWICVWDAMQDGSVTALSRSSDLRKWTPQRYFASRSDLPHDIFVAAKLSADSAEIGGVQVHGYRQAVDKAVVDSILAYADRRAALDALYGETCAGDSAKYDTTKPFEAVLRLQPESCKKISDKLIGIFFEDINYGADGGLYGELIQNRDFEHSPADNAAWNAMTGWSVAGDGQAHISHSNPLHKNNANYLSVSDGRGLVLTNGGYDGIAVTKGESYRCSIFARTPSKAKIRLSLVDEGGRVLSTRSLKISGNEWKQYRTDLKASANAGDASLRLTIDGDADIDMVSLFPAKTFRGRENGLRADLAQTFADLRPRFVRFPGGCVAHGNGIDNIYDWKGSIGPLEGRRPLSNLWGYHQTRGLGYYEYFLFCEDIGAEPLPVVAAGVPCQNSGCASHHSHDSITRYGQQGGIPADEMEAYVQDILDLIEYANGSPDSEWGAKRAEAGHPEPFGLKYIGVGNEDLISEVFEPRFKMIYEAIRKAHPEITVVGTVGPFYEGSDYDRGWELAEELHIPVVDEHYYVSPGWLVNNRDYYDNYNREGARVYLGEWAAHLQGRPSNMETALAEALYLTDIERNADVVTMTSYAPLLAKEGHTQWRPDLVYFSNNEIHRTPDYYVQKLYGNNSGDHYVPSELLSAENEEYTKRVGASVVIDSETGDIILKVVNMLPISAKINVEGIGQGIYKGQQLSGNPADEKQEPSEVEIALPAMTLPAYSFTVLRLPATAIASI